MICIMSAIKGSQDTVGAFCHRGSTLSTNKLGARSYSELKQFPFPATARKVGSVQGLHTTDMILKEPALFSADLPYALAQGGIITNIVLKKLMEMTHLQSVIMGKLPGHQIIVDSRIHTLTKGEYPAIPGWHTDFIERTAKTRMQPDYRLITPSVKTYVINISDREGGVSNTEYAKDSVLLDIPPDNVYMKIDEQLQKIRTLRTFKASDGDIVEMDQLSLHRATPAHADGMRYFLRLAVLHNLSNTILKNAPQNEVRRHVQSYRDMNESQARHSQQLMATIPPTISNNLSISHLGVLRSFYPVKEIKEEPMLVDAGFAFANSKGGPILKQFLNFMLEHPMIQEAIESGHVENITINTRVHMLMKGQYPDLSFWRHNAPFEEGLSPANLRDQAHHFLMLVSSKPDGVCGVELKVPSATHHGELPSELDPTKTGTFLIKEGVVVHFKDGIHNRSLKASQFGWRMAIVMTLNGKTLHKNKIVSQVPVFLDNISLGW